MAARIGESGQCRDGPIRVLIVDDSAAMRALLTQLLAEDPQIAVIGSAGDAYAAREKIKQLQPDVLTLDVQLPQMDGLQFLRNLMRLRPMPVVMCSSLARDGAQVTLTALELGAVEFIAKPGTESPGELAAFGAELIGKVKAAAGARVQPALTASDPAVRAAGARACAERVIGIGASTGGTEAIRALLASLPPDAPALLIAQHMPPAFTAQFAARLDACSALRVCEAEDGAELQPGRAYVAPGDRHLLVVRDGRVRRCHLSDAPPVNRHRPSVDLLFESMAEQLGADATGVILTGMGSDGARGLQRLRAAGGRTIAQDAASSVVWGMPGAAVALGAAERTLALAAIPAALLEEGRPGRRRASGGA